MRKRGNKFTILAFTSIILSVVFLGYIIYSMASYGRNSPEVHIALNLWTTIGLVFIRLFYSFRMKEIKDNVEDKIKFKHLIKKLFLIYFSAYVFIFISSIWILLNRN